MQADRKWRNDRIARSIPSSLAFGAEDTTPQEITVTATGVEWEYTLPSSADWITVDDGTAGKLLVSVVKNPTAEKRTASIAVKPVNNDDVKAKSVTVTQAGSETPEVYSLTVDPAALTFEAEGAAGQSVKVTASGEGITWSAAVDEAAKEWITLSATEGTEGETTLTVTVQEQSRNRTARSERYADTERGVGRPEGHPRDAGGQGAAPLFLDVLQRRRRTGRGIYY